MSGSAPSNPSQLLNGSVAPDNVQPATSSPLHNDETFVAIHDAFLMGWSLYELKSRVLIEAFHANSNSSSTETIDFSSLISAGSPLNSAKRASQLIDTLLNEALPKTHEKLSNTADTIPSWFGDTTQTTSIWRALFNRIVSLHTKRFPNSNTAKTVYDTLDANYPYLTSNPTPPYADVGIRQYTSNDGQTSPLDNFKLYEMTRRALNCLTLLHTNLNDSLIPEVIGPLQIQLVKDILEADQPSPIDNPPAVPTQTPPDGTNSTPTTSVNNTTSSEAPQTTAPDATQAASAAPADKVDRKLQAGDINTAIKIYSGLTVQFLDAWDEYLRESFYVDDASDNNGNAPVSREIELTAYEAARSMASLSWGISALTAPIEGIAQENKHSIKHLHTIWSTIFNSRYITLVQHQITALSTSLDLVYYRVNSGAPRQDPNAVLVRPNLELPSLGIQAIKHSLDYWQRTVELMCNTAEQNLDGTDTNTNPASSPETNIETRHQSTTPEFHLPFSPSSTAATNLTPVESTTTGVAPSAAATNIKKHQSPLPTMNLAMSKQLRQVLISQADVWQSLLLCQQNLKAFTIESVTRKIWSDFMQKFEAVLSQLLLDRADKTFREVVERHRFILVIIGIGVVVLVLGFLIVAPLLGLTNITPATIAAGTAAVILGAITSASNALRSPATGTASSAAPGAFGAIPQFSGMLGPAESAIFEAFQNGYQQILIEFDSLNHNVSVAGPLIEYFVESDFHKLTGEEIKVEINNAYDFLTQVIWTNQDRQDEIEQVARAAFGPIGAFVGQQLGLTKPLTLPSRGPGDSSTLPQAGQPQARRPLAAGHPTNAPGLPLQLTGNTPATGAHHHKPSSPTSPGVPGKTSPVTSQSAKVNGNPPS